MRGASDPTSGSVQKVNRIMRHLKVRRRCVLSFPWIGKQEETIQVCGRQGLGWMHEDEVFNLRWSIENWKTLIEIMEHDTGTKIIDFTWTGWYKSE